MNILINKNYGDNYTVQPGATVVARGAEAAMMREQIVAQQNADFDGQEVSDEVSDVEIRMKKVRYAIRQMQEEKCPLCKNNFFGSGQAYQYAYLYALMSDGKCCETYHLPRFKTSVEFLQYLKELGLEKLCSDQTIDNQLKLMSGSYPNWEIIRGSEKGNLIANKVASRFLVLYREG
jgi:hypothetical protein